MGGRAQVIGRPGAELQGLLDLQRHGVPLPLQHLAARAEVLRQVRRRQHLAGQAALSGALGRQGPAHFAGRRLLTS